MQEINDLFQKYDHFKDAQIRSILTPTPDSVMITIVTQDDDGEDQDRVEIRFDGVEKKRLLVSDVLPFLDMMSGVSIINEHGLFGFSIGNCSAMLAVLNAPLFVVAKSVQVN